MSMTLKQTYVLWTLLYGSCIQGVTTLMLPKWMYRLVEFAPRRNLDALQPRRLTEHPITTPKPSVSSHSSSIDNWWLLAFALSPLVVGLLIHIYLYFRTRYRQPVGENFNAPVILRRYANENNTISTTHDRILSTTSLFPHVEECKSSLSIDDETSIQVMTPTTSLQLRHAMRSTELNFTMLETPTLMTKTQERIKQGTLELKSARAWISSSSTSPYSESPVLMGLPASPFAQLDRSSSTSLPPLLDSSDYDCDCSSLSSVSSGSSHSTERVGSCSTSTGSISISPDQLEQALDWATQSSSHPFDNIQHQEFDQRVSCFIDQDRFKRGGVNRTLRCSSSLTDFRNDVHYEEDPLRITRNNECTL